MINWFTFVSVLVCGCYVVSFPLLNWTVGSIRWQKEVDETFSILYTWSDDHKRVGNDFKKQNCSNCGVHSWAHNSNDKGTKFLK